MRIISAINAKGGCGKSSISISLAAALGRKGYKVLLSDMDPQAQLSEWLHIGDGLSWQGTIVGALIGREDVRNLVQKTAIKNVSFLASSSPLEEYGRDAVSRPNYVGEYAAQIAKLAPDFDFLVIDCPNQISPIMEQCIFVTDLFMIPFESTKAVKSYANVVALMMKLRPDTDYKTLHVLNNVFREGLRNRIMERMEQEGIPRAKTEVRNCGWLAQVDEHGGNIFEYRPHAKGAEDMAELAREVLATLETPAAIKRSAHV